jgi:uncharacterized protein YggE
MRQLARLVFVLAVAAAAPGVAAAADDDAAKRRTIAVSGVGEVQTVPDMAVLSAGVVTDGSTARTALTANSTAMTKVVKSVRDAGVEARDVQTASVNVSPVYSRQTQPGDPPRVSGYRASNMVTVRLRELAKLGAMLDALVAAGANQMHGVRLTVAEPEKPLDEARKKAVADARRKAELFAAASGVRVGAILSVEEAEGAIPMQRAMAAARMEAASVPVEPGEIEMRASVRVVFAIE